MNTRASLAGILAAKAQQKTAADEGRPSSLEPFAWPSSAARFAPRLGAALNTRNRGMLAFAAEFCSLGSQLKTLGINQPTIRVLQLHHLLISGRLRGVTFSEQQWTAAKS